jgi:hypothetical protein
VIPKVFCTGAASQRSLFTPVHRTDHLLPQDPRNQLLEDKAVQ